MTTPRDPGQLKAALRAREQTIGSWLTFPCEATAEIMARAGFDWLVLDMEHAPLGVAEAARPIRVIDLAGLPAICRLPSNDPAIAKGVLDAGAMGIMVPYVSSAEEARRAVASAYYPPDGNRGVGLARAQAYGRGLEAYRGRMQESLVVIAMIETREGVEQAGAIAATPGLDGLLIGPYDLSASMGQIGKLDHPSVQAAGARVRQAAESAGIACGIHVVHPRQAVAQQAARDGYTFMAVGVDMILLDESASAAASILRDRAHPAKPDAVRRVRRSRTRARVEK